MAGRGVQIMRRKSQLVENIMKLSERFYLPDNMKPMADELDTASERATALIAGAIVDDALSAIIKLRLIDEPKIIKEFFEGQGGLATFSSRIAMARLMNFYSDETYSDLNIMRKVRNDAAHATKPFSFSDQANASRSRSLKVPNKHFFESGAETADDVAAIFVQNIDEIKNDPLLRYVGTAIFLSWQFSGWAGQKPEHLRPQGLKRCAV